jgi:HAD superfamily phosphatase (TIGR01668 family)
MPIFRSFTPDLFLSSVLELHAGRLRSLGLDGLLLDLDGTLKDHGATELPAPVCAWIAALRAEGIRLCLVSNGRTQRIAHFAGLLGIPFVAKAFKPLPRGCHRALAILELEPTRVGMVGDQVFADIVAGRLAGLRTVLVPPTNPSEPWFTRIKRPFERQLLRWLNLRPATPIDSGGEAAGAAVSA